ncbi:MAG: MBL fold metallo-hydrolase [Methylococcaceae bacterium]|nr:MBL fold metallo-hydrolase [Methylococcaceae bacterium]
MRLFRNPTNSGRGWVAKKTAIHPTSLTGLPDFAEGSILTQILNTHHHGDHVGGNLALKRYCTEISSAFLAA